LTQQAPTGREPIDAREVQRLVAKGEGPLLEFKPGETRPGELATSLAAFANAEGGTLLLGVVERNGEPVIDGVADAKLTLDHLYTAAGLCSPTLEITDPDEVQVKGRLILAVSIPAGLRHVYNVEGRYLQRRGSFRRALDVGEIRSLMNRRGVFAFDTMRVAGASRSDLDEALVQAFAARFRSGERMAADALLEARELLVGAADTPGNDLVPTVAGLLLLGKRPQRFLHQARVAVVRYAGTTMGERFLAREIDGPIPSQLAAVEDWFTASLLHAVELRGSARLDHDEYPREALREAVLNALVHRDYSLTGDRIRIYVFGDRLEVHSPGRLGGPMRLDNLLSQRWSRNAALVEGMVALGGMEELGFGLDRLTAALDADGLPPPEFRETEGTFIVTLYGHPGGLLAAPRTPESQRTATDVPVGQRRMRSAERQVWLLEHLRVTGSIKTRVYAEGVNVSLDTALNDLTGLVDRGLIQAHGTTRDRTWSLRHESA